MRTRLENYRRRRAVQKVRPGNGRPLKPFRWWQPTGRALFHLTLPAGTRTVEYSVDVRHWQQFTTEDGRGKAHLYLDGRHHAQSPLPAVFAVEGGVIEVASTNYGLKRCHYLADDGTEQQLVPDAKSGEGRRARLHRDHPGLSRTLGAMSMVVLLISLALLVAQIAEKVSAAPPIAEQFGTFDSPVHLAWWQNTTVTVLAAVASTERAMRLRYSALLD